MEKTSARSWWTAGTPVKSGFSAARVVGTEVGARADPRH